MMIPVIVENCKHERTIYMETLELCSDCGSIFRLKLVERGGDVDLVRGPELVLGRTVVMELAEALILEDEVLEATQILSMGCD